VKKLRYIVVLGLVLLFSVEVQSQCAMCRENAKGSGMDINSGIIFLMLIPYILLFVLFRKKIIAFIKEFRGMQ